MDGPVFTFVAALCLGSSILFGLAPALHISKTNVNDVLKESGRSAAGSVRAGRWTGALMVVELALHGHPPRRCGVDGAQFRRALPNRFCRRPLASGHWTGVAAGAKIRDCRCAQSILPLDSTTSSRPIVAIEAVTTAADIPFATLGGSVRQLSIDGRMDPAGLPPPNVSYVYVGDDYFDTLGLRLAHGRGFVDADGEPGHEGAVVNQRFATLFFPHDEVLGQRIRVTAAGGPNPNSQTSQQTGPWLTVVGVVPTLPQFGPRELAIEPVVYVPVGAEPAPGRFCRSLRADRIQRRSSPRSATRSAR